MKRQVKYSIGNLKKSHQSLVLVLMGDFTSPNVCWKTAERKQCERSLQCVADNFLTAVEWTNSGRCPSGPAVSEQGRTAGWRDSWRPSWTEGSSNDKLLPDSRLCPVYETGWKSPLGGNLEEQRSLGRLDILQGYFKGTGAGCPHVPEDEPVDKKNQPVLTKNFD